MRSNPCAVANCFDNFYEIFAKLKLWNWSPNLPRFNRKVCAAFKVKHLIHLGSLAKKKRHYVEFIDNAKTDIWKTIFKYHLSVFADLKLFTSFI